MRRPGGWAEVEWHRASTGSLTAPASLGVGYSSDSEFDAATVVVQVGSRWRGHEGLLVESSLGLGVVAAWYHAEGIFYQDRWGNHTRHGEGPNIGLMPATDLCRVDLVEHIAPPT